MAVKYKSTAEVKVPKKIIDQVIGQDEAVEVIKKAAQQRRHVLLIGEPGTGKSMLGLALAELLPMEKLTDIISFPNPNDENMPLIRTVPAGQGRDLVAKAKIQSMTTFKNQNLIMFVLVMLATFLPYYFWRAGKISDVIFAASIISSIGFIGILLISFNLGKRVTDNKVKVPRLIVDNYKRKQAPFNDATGAHAGALLGDVLHDPFQSFFPILKINKLRESKVESVEINKEIDEIFDRHKDKILKKEENNYEAVFLPKNKLSVLGEIQGSISPVEVLSANRYYYNGKMIKLTTSENKELIVTPEHKIAVNQNGKIAYVEAKNLKVGEGVISKEADIIIDEQDIINTVGINIQ